MLLRPTLLASFVAAFALFSACDHPNPLAPAEAIGEFPEWGLAFTEEAKAPAADGSMLSPGPAPSASPNQAELSGPGGTAVPAPKPKTDLAKGDANYGKQLFSSLCARCHRGGGEGGEMPMIGMVPNLTDAAWHGRISDSQISSTIAHGKGKMPAFIGQLNKSEIASVVAYIRLLKK